ncbi:MAG: glycosyltransferase N-terminal domain-containing protein [Candidatus Firestonebacteria bacterium]
MPIQIIIYNILYSTVILILLPFFVLAAVFVGKYRTGLLNRFGIIPYDFRIKVKGWENIWIHAASAGEIKCVLPLAEELVKKYPRANIVFTTTGINGQRMLKEVSRDIAACYLPLDLYFFIKPLVKLIKPKILVVAETEYWPNLFYLAKHQGAKIVIVNGRFSSKAVKRYSIAGPVIKKVFALTDVFAMRNQEDAEILSTLGAGREKIVITGDLKYEKPVVEKSRKEALETVLGPVLREKVLVLGSIHYKEAGEIFGAFRLIKALMPGVTLILAPRFMEEIPLFIGLIKTEGFSYAKRSKAGRVQVDIIILDTFGELTYAYGLCSVAFVGGSLVDGIGGHNLLEPVYLGKPVLFGPYAFNYKEMEEEVKNNLVGFLVKDSADMAEKACGLLNNAAMLGNIEKASIEFLEKRKGSLFKTLELL